MKKFRVDKNQVLSKDAQKKVAGGWGETCMPRHCSQDSFLVGGGEHTGVCAIATSAPGGGICIGVIEENMCYIY
ncbi:hypothetical protein [Microscilla marina]|nr:hypothetical protein [Microscilla marina]